MNTRRVTRPHFVLVQTFGLKCMEYFFFVGHGVLVGYTARVYGSFFLLVSPYKHTPTEPQKMSEVDLSSPGAAARAMLTQKPPKGKEIEEAGAEADAGAPEVNPSRHIQVDSKILPPEKAEFKKEHFEDIKVKHLTAERWPKECKSKKNTIQRFFVVRAIFPEDVKEVANKKLQENWGNNRVAIQLLGALPSEKKAKMYAESLSEIDDALNIYVLDMYEWILLPPDEPVPEADDDEGMAVKRSQPLLQDYMNAFNKKEVENAELMKMRLEMAKQGVETTDIMTPEHSEWARNERIANLRKILDNRDEYPDAMIEMAEKKLAEEMEGSKAAEPMGDSQ